MTRDPAFAKAVALIARLESFRARAYQCEADVWTIGYGRIEGVQPGDVTDEPTEKLHLLARVAEDLAAVREAAAVPLADHEAAALTSWAYNVGREAMRDSTLMQRLAAGDREAVPGELARWNKVKGKVNRGLVNRRAVEVRVWRGAPVPARKPLAKSRTIAGSAVAGTATVASGALEAAQDTLTGLAPYLDVARYALLAVVLVGVALVVYARIDDARRGVR